jgi:ABC-type arginine transport system permease subunit
MCLRGAVRTPVAGSYEAGYTIPMSSASWRRTVSLPQATVAYGNGANSPHSVAL